MWFVLVLNRAIVVVNCPASNWDLSLVLELGSMTTNKERIEALEAGLNGVQTGMQRLEETISRLLEVMISNTESSNHNTSVHGPSWTYREEFDGPPSSAMRCKEDVHKDFASIVMRSSLLGIDEKALNFFYWKEILMLKPKKTIERSTPTFLPTPRFHYTLKQDGQQQRQIS